VNWHRSRRQCVFEALILSFIGEVEVPDPLLPLPNGPNLELRDLCAACTAESAISGNQKAASPLPPTGRSPATNTGEAKSRFSSGAENGS
jgi:hypothetical protein